MSRRTTTTTTKAPASCTKDGRYLKKGCYFLRTPPEEWNLTDFLKREYVNRVSQRKLFGACESGAHQKVSVHPSREASSRLRSFKRMEIAGYLQRQTSWDQNDG